MAVECDRCEKFFRTYNSYQQHVRDSSRHYECPGCDFDGESWEDLLDHCRDTNCRSVCKGCNDGSGSHWGFGCDAYWRHVDEQNVCTTCERHFETPANLEAHKLTHRSADIECLACDREFTSYGGMIIHLESGSCDSGINIIDLNETAATCHWWNGYIDADYQNDMVCRRDFDEYYSQKVYPYECPTCDAYFSKLSSLFQHVESSACSQTLNKGSIRRLRRYLNVRHGS